MDSTREYQLGAPTTCLLEPQSMECTTQHRASNVWKWTLMIPLLWKPAYFDRCHYHANYDKRLGTYVERRRNCTTKREERTCATGTGSGRVVQVARQRSAVGGALSKAFLHGNWMKITYQYAAHIKTK